MVNNEVLIDSIKVILIGILAVLFSLLSNFVYGTLNFILIGAIFAWLLLFIKLIDLIMGMGDWE